MRADADSKLLTGPPRKPTTGRPRMHEPLAPGPLQLKACVRRRNRRRPVWTTWEHARPLAGLSPHPATWESTSRAPLRSYAAEAFRNGSGGLSERSKAPHAFGNRQEEGLITRRSWPCAPRQIMVPRTSGASRGTLVKKAMFWCTRAVAV